MRLEALQTLLGLRQAERKIAQQDLAAAIQAEAEALKALGRANEDITREAQAATALTADDRAVEAYARWLPIGRKAASDASAVLDQATHQVTVARAVLMLAKTEENAVSSQVDRCKDQIEQSRAAREQADLDEISSRRRL